MKLKTTSGRKLTLCIIIFCLVVPLVCCFGATRLPTRVVNPVGTKISPKEIDLEFLQLGVTQRDEVAHQLALVDTTYDNPRLFWGRWSESRWGYWWILGMPCDNCMAGNAGRMWRMKNVLVSFDQNGLLSRKDMIGDDKIWQALHARIAEIQPPLLDLSQPVRISLTTPDPISIELNPDTMEFLRPEESNKASVEVMVRKLVRFRHSPIGEQTPSPSISCHNLEFSEKTTLGKKIWFCAEANQIGILFEYLQQVAPPTMNWR